MLPISAQIFNGEKGSIGLKTGVGAVRKAQFCQPGWMSALLVRKGEFRPPISINLGHSSSWSQKSA